MSPMERLWPSLGPDIAQGALNPLAAGREWSQDELVVGIDAWGAFT